MKNLIVCLAFVFMLSCNKENNISQKIINGNDDYWAYYDEEDSPIFSSIYFKFKANGKSDRYCRESDNSSLHVCKDSDVITSNIPWTISKDSILTWGINNYRIINCNESVIVLYSLGEPKRHKFLIKEYSGKLRKGHLFYENINVKNNN